MKKFTFLLSLLGILLFDTTNLLAQGSEVFAGGEINVEYVGDGTEECGDPKPYRFTLKFYRDCLTRQFAADKTIRLVVPDDVNLGVQFLTITLDQTTDFGTLESRCVDGNPTCTEGRWYSATRLLPPSEEEWRVTYSALNMNGNLIGRDFFSPEFFNIDLQQRFFVESFFTNKCADTVKGVLNGNQVARELKTDNTPAQWLTPHILETFCDGVDYEYRLKVRDTDTIRFDKNLLDNKDTLDGEVTDSLAFRIVSTRTGNGQAVNYLPGFSSNAPLPSTKPFSFNEREGIFSFTPELRVGETNFAAIVTFEVQEWRKLPVKLQGSNVLRIRPQLINRTFRQMRFVINENCDKRLPEFSALNAPFNVAENAWEFNCSDDIMEWEMSEPMLVRDLDDNTFRIWRGTADFPTEPGNAFDPDAIIPLNTSATGEFTRFRVVLNRKIGPGNYTMFPKKSSKGVTLTNTCGFSLDEEVDIPIYVNRNSNYVFPKDVVPICYPADFPTGATKLNAFRGQTDKKKEKYAFSTWREFQGNPSGIPEDTVFAPDPGFDLQLERDINGDFISPEGIWEVGFAEDFNWINYEGELQEASCFATDRFFLEFFENDSVHIPDFDLCENEPWPVVNLDSMTTLHDADRYEWRFMELTPNKSGGIDTNWVTIGGEASDLGKNDSLDVAGAAFGLNQRFTFASAVFLENGKCVERDTFEVQKARVIVELEPGGDSIVCPGEEFLIVNDRTYFIPDSMSFEWSLDGQVIPGADSNSLRVFETGLYKLRVTKSTPGSSCFGEDSVFVRIADSIGIPEPVCAEVRWNTDIDDVEQTFFVPFIFGAEDFQARSISQDGEVGEWGEIDNEQRFTVIGPQRRFEVRGVNREVSDSAICRFGPTAIAEPCNVVVKPVNIFTPNGDGINDLLRFDLLEVFPGSKLQIFNRWGRLIFETDNYQNDWDGEDYEDGVYFYILDINDESQGLQKGTVTIVR